MSLQCDLTVGCKRVEVLDGISIWLINGKVNQIGENYKSWVIGMMQCSHELQFLLHFHPL